MEKEKKFQLNNAVTIGAAHMVHDIYSSFLAPILPLLIEKLSMSLSLAGLLSVVQRIPSLLNPLIGLAADKLPIRYMLIIAPSITAVSMSLLGVAPSYTVLVILLFVMGIGASMFHVPAPVMMKHVSGERIGKGMSFFMFGGEIARSIGPLVILGAVSIWGLGGTYKLIPFGLIASLILFFRLKNIQISKDFKKREKQKGNMETFKNVLPLFITITGIIFFIAVMQGSLTAFLPTYITEKGKSLWIGGFSLSGLELAGAAGTFFSGTISDKIGRRNTLLIIAVVSPALMWLFILSNNLLAIFFLIVLGIFLFGTTPILLAIVNDNASEQPSFINGIYMTINFIVGGASIFLVGLLGDFVGLDITYKITATLALLSIPFILKLPAKNQTHSK